MKISPRLRFFTMFSFLACFMVSMTARHSEAANGTLTFTSNAGLGDGIAQDGDGGSTALSGIDIQVINITNTGGTPFGTISWENNAFLSSSDSGYSALTYNLDAGTKGMAIKSSDGSEFQLNGFKYYDWGETSPKTNTIKGYRNAVEVAYATFDGYSSTATPQVVSLDSSFDNVDEVRFYISAGGYLGNQSASNHSINNVVIADAVASPPLVVIQPTALLANPPLFSASYAAANSFSQDGLSSPYTSGVTAFTTYVAANPAQGIGGGVTTTYVMSAAGTPTGDWDYDLGATYNLNRFLFWNTQNDLVTYVKTFEILVDDNAAFSSPESAGTFSAFTTITGSTEYPTPLEFFTLTQRTGRYVRFRVLSNNGADRHLFGEVAFAGNPAAPPSAPEIAVTETGVGAITDGGSFSFGTTTVGTAVTKTFTVTNSGTATLNLSNLSVPSGFTIASGFGSSTVAASGGTTTFQVTMTAGAAATPSGSLSFTNDDTDENPYNFTISGTVNPPPGIAVTSLVRANGNPSNASTVNWTLTFASVVTGVTGTNFTLTGAAAAGASIGTPISGNGGLSYNIPVTTGSTDGVLTLNLANATGLSSAISTTLPYADQSYTMDKTAPTVLSVTRLSPSGQATNQPSVTFLVTYSEPVTLNAPESARYAVIPVGGSSIVGSVTGVTGTGDTRNVTVSISSGTGEFRLRVLD